jgi:hypothetical protein
MTGFKPLLHDLFAALLLESFLPAKVSPAMVLWLSWSAA